VSTVRYKLFRNVAILSTLLRKSYQPSCYTLAYTNSAKLDNDFLEAFTNSYTSSRPTAPSSSETSFSARYQRGKQITAYAYNLIERFEKDNDETVKIEVTGLTTNSWVKEYKDVENVITAGRDVGLQKYEALADGVGEPEIDEDMVEFVKSIYKPEHQPPGIGWGRMARKQDKALKKVDKNFVREITV
jgi:hypothetical protein